MLIDDKTAEKFAEYMNKYPKLYESLAKITQENIPKSLNRPFIVDLGVGPGFLPLGIHRLIPDAYIAGIDPVPKMLELAKKHALEHDFKKFEAVLAVAENIPLKSNSTDMVVSRFSLTFWEKPDEGLTEIRRILKPGGRVILETLNRDCPKWKLFFIKLHMLLNAAGKEAINYHIDSYKYAYSADQVEKLIRDANLKIIKKDGNKGEWKNLFIAEKNLNK